MSEPPPDDTDEPRPTRKNARFRCNLAFFVVSIFLVSFLVDSFFVCAFVSWFSRFLAVLGSPRSASFPRRWHLR